MKTQIKLETDKNLVINHQPPLDLLGYAMMNLNDSIYLTYPTQPNFFESTYVGRIENGWIPELFSYPTS